MKKLFVILAVAAVTLVSCKKEETKFEQAAGELSLKPATGLMTKTGELNGTFMPAATYTIYAVATQKNAAGVIENPSFFGVPATPEMAFNATAETAAYSNKWVATPKVYWPFGGVKMDFLAYAMPTADHNPNTTSDAAQPDWTANWINAKTDVASKLIFKGVDTYKNQVDMLYANANDQTSAANGFDGSNDQSVKMDFKHAQALLIFNAKVTNADANVTIDSISFLTDARVKAMLDHQVALFADPSATLAASTPADITLKTVGTFTVDNSRIDLVAGWSDLESKYPSMPNGTDVSPCNLAAISAALRYGSDPLKAVNAQLGASLLIPEQPKVKFTVSYTIGDKHYLYTVNDLRGVWQANKKYIYNLDITINEIVITESVADFEENVTDITLD